MSLISIIIPMRNAEPFISGTLHSLVEQEGCDFEIIVVNDGSTDRSAEIVRAFHDPRIRIVRGPQRGISAAFNCGLTAARGEFFCRCDADDLYPPGRLQRQSVWLRDHPEFGAVCGSVSTIDSTGRHVADHYADHTASEDTRELLEGRGRSHLSAYLFRTDLLRRIGGCREWFVTSEDADLQFRLAEIARVWFDPECAYLYRLHDASVTHMLEVTHREFFEEASRRFLRQRRNGGMDDLQRRAPPPVPAGGARGHRSTRRQIQEILLGRAWSEHGAGQKAKALSTGLRALSANPSDITVWKSLVALALKPAGRKPN